MAGYMYLGSQRVCPAVFVGGEPPAEDYNMSVANFVGETDSNGIMVTPTQDLNPVFYGVKRLSTEILRGKFSSNSRIKSVSFPDLENINTAGCLNQTFNGCPNLSSLSVPKLKTISGFNCMNESFRSTNIVSVTFDELESVGIENQFNSELSYMFAKCSNLESVYLPKLKYLYGAGSFGAAFDECPKLKTIDLPELEYIGYGGALQMFQGTALETVRFPKLNALANMALYLAFNNCESIQSVYFNNISTSTFSDYTNQFEYMLVGCTGVELHFPSNLSSLIPTLDGYPNFGGTNTTILYDLEATE